MARTTVHRENATTVAERHDILKVRDELLENTLKATPSAVKIRLQNENISIDSVRTGGGG